MKDIKAIVNKYQSIDFNQRKVALATVVRVHGSSYRCPGARMLITDDGRWIGSISGGCLEGDALRKARMVMLDNKAITHTYDTREESNQQLGFALGCNGIIEVLIEPILHNDAKNAINIFQSFVNTKESVVLATVFSSNTGIADKALLNEQGQVLYDFQNKNLLALIQHDALQLFSTKKSETKKYFHNNEEIEVFIELIQPSISLLIFGAGFDARPVCDLAKSLGWNVHVTDECAAHILPVFFPMADKLSHCDRTFLKNEIEITPYTACVLMSHNYNYDKDVLKNIMHSATPYIGILGPKKRFAKMEIELADEGIPLSENILQRIHSPIGLDIGAETPEEIALSIIAEIQSVFAQRSGAKLKNRAVPIHDRDAANNQIFKQVYLAH